MVTYIALIRGINVTGNKIVPMAKLREMFEALGFKQVRTYIASGNVIFQAAKTAPEKLSRKIEAEILKEFGFSASVITKTPEELAAALSNNPFLKEKNIDPSKLHVSFLSDVGAEAGISKLAALETGCDRFHCVGREIYLHCPDGYGNTKLNNNVLEKLLGVTATTRNWNTVSKLYAMAVE